MAKRIAYDTLNASTLKILNTIRANASLEYQQNVPKIDKVTDIPKVGEIIYGTPAFANQFINSLVNRIALVVVNSATFNNPYAVLKKGYLEFGETVEEIFVKLADAVEYNPEKAPAREFQRVIPGVKSAFHTMNWRVMYPVTIEDEDLKLAFLNEGGVQSLITKIIESVYKAAEYDEFLLFKYMLIKSISKGKFYPVSIGDGTDLTKAAVKFRGISNTLTFMSTDYNEAGVNNNTPKDKQVIFMDAMFNAEFDVNVLASAFNMDKATFMGRLFLIDNWATFDNKRWEVIRANSDGVEEVTSEELELMKNVKSVVIDETWFQVYDNRNIFKETQVSSGLYWNYFYHVWKTISNSPFSNAVVFVVDTATITPPASLTAHIMSKDESAEAFVFTIGVESEEATLEPYNVNFVQTDALVKAGIAVHPYGAIVIPADQHATEITLVATIGNNTYTAATTINSTTAVDATVTLNKA